MRLLHPLVCSGGWRPIRAPAVRSYQWNQAGPSDLTFLVVASVAVLYGISPQWFARTFLGVAELDRNLAHVLQPGNDCEPRRVQHRCAALRCLLPAVNRRSPPPPSWRLALPPADRDQASHERHQSNPEPERVAVSRDEYAEGDEQADIHAKHHPALPRARRSPAPAITLRRKPVAWLVGFTCHSGWPHRFAIRWR